MKKICIAFILTAFISCSKQRIIPEKTLVEIIYRMYITDAALAVHEHEPSMRHKDSMRIYEPVVEQFGYNIEDLRRTFLKYTAQDGKLQSVLDKVSKRVEDEKDIYQPVARIEKLSENMNVGADSVSIVSNSVNEYNIEVKLSEQGVYDVSASYFFYENDSTKNPRMSVRLESKIYKDSIKEKQEIRLEKDTVFNDYALKVKFNNPNFNILRISWLDFDKVSDTVKPETPATLPQRTTDKRINARKKTDTKNKPDTITRQHYIVKRMSVKYNFEESDTTRLKEFIGPVLPDFDRAGAVPVIMGTAPIIMGTAPIIMGTAPIIMGTAPIIMGTAPIIMGTAPIIMGMAPAQSQCRQYESKKGHFASRRDK